VGLTVVAVVALAVVAGSGRQVDRTGPWLAGARRAVAGWRRTPRFAAGVAVWTLLILAVVGWDLTSFVRQSHDLPTLSDLFGRVTRYHWGRALVFGAWLVAGLALALACRAPERRRRRRRP
jgi:hypothetical protein